MKLHERMLRAVEGMLSGNLTCEGYHHVADVRGWRLAAVSRDSPHVSS